MAFLNALFNSTIQYIIAAVVAVLAAFIGITIAKNKARKKKINEAE